MHKQDRYSSFFSFHGFTRKRAVTIGTVHGTGVGGGRRSSSGAGRGLGPLWAQDDTSHRAEQAFLTRFSTA